MIKLFKFYISVYFRRILLFLDIKKIHMLYNTTRFFVGKLQNRVSLQLCFCVQSTTLNICYTWLFDHYFSFQKNFFVIRSFCRASVAQLDRASPSGGEGRRFESCWTRQIYYLLQFLQYILFNLFSNTNFFVS